MLYLNLRVSRLIIWAYHLYEVAERIVAMSFSEELSLLVRSRHLPFYLPERRKVTKT